MVKFSGIYQIQSQIHPDRIYIGSAVDIRRRWKEHLCRLRNNKHGNSKLQRHFNKYGEQDLQFSILCGCEKDQLLQFEQYYLDFYQPWNFNDCKVAGSNLGKKFSEKVKHNMSKAQRGKHHTEEAKRNMSKAKMGHTPWNKGIPCSEETKHNLIPFSKGDIPWNKGKHHSEEQKQHLRDAWVRRKQKQIA